MLTDPKQLHSMNLTLILHQYLFTVLLSSFLFILVFLFEISVMLCACISYPDFFLLK